MNATNVRCCVKKHRQIEMYVTPIQQRNFRGFESSFNSTQPPLHEANNHNYATVTQA